MKRVFIIGMLLILVLGLSFYAAADENKVVLHETFEDAVVGEGSIQYYKLDDMSIKEYPKESEDYALRWQNSKAVGLALDETVTISKNKKLVAIAKVRWLGNGTTRHVFHNIGLSNEKVGYAMRIKIGSGVGALLKYSEVPWQRSIIKPDLGAPSYDFGEIFTLRLEWDYETITAYVGGEKIGSVEDDANNNITVDRLFLSNWYHESVDVKDVLVEEVKVEVITK